MILFRFALAAFAIVLIFIGLLAMIAPTPFGFVLVILGFLLLASAAPGLVRWLRVRWRWRFRVVLPAATTTTRRVHFGS